MTSPIAQYTEVRESIKEQIDKARNLIKETFEQGALNVLEENNLESFSWEQYTPFFNDGDECVFGVYYDYPRINGMGSEDFPGRPKDAKWDSPEYQEWYAKRQAYEQPIKDFLGQFDQSDLQWLFGDHVTVTVTKNGIETEENVDHE